MSTSFLVESPGGTFIRKTREELQPDDRVVFDGPESFRRVDAAQKRLDDAIASAGGLEAWKAARPSNDGA